MAYRILCAALGAVVLSTPLASRAGPTNNTFVRCSNDQLNTAGEVSGRNHWAHKCGYIDADDLRSFTAKNRYVVFSNLDHPPTDAGAACIPGLSVLSFCVLAGCFPPEQQVMFSGQYQAIGVSGAEAYTPTITTPSASWLVGDDLSGRDEQSVDYFVVGDEVGKVLEFKTDNGKQVTVTLTHPMVLSNGDIRAAEKVQRSDSLLTTEGASKITAIVAHDYAGKVWNVAPKSRELNANLLFAQDIITGSYIYQNDWAQDESRLHLRKRIDPEAF